MGRTAALLLALALFAAGCRSPRTFAPFDLTAPGWETRTGQALWRPDAQKPEVAGDVVVSSRPGQGAYLEFSKTLPIVSAWLTPAGWRVEYPPAKRRYAGPGEPPVRLGWLQLLRGLNGDAVAPPWELSRGAEGQVTLENPRTGERLEVHF